MRTLLRMYQTTVPPVFAVEQQIIGIPITVEISQSHRRPADRKSRTRSVADANVVVHVPNDGASGRCVDEQVIRMIVAIKIRYARQAPASEESWTVSMTDPNIIVHIPNRRLARACIEKKEIGPRVTIEIRER